MTIWKISLHNIKSKPLYTFLGVFSLALSITLLLGMQQLKTSFEHQINNNLGGVDLVIGAKGSPLQLILASVLHLDNPTGNISYQEAKKIAKNPLIESAIPISFGDNYKGFRIVGTTNTFKGLYDAEINEGREFKKALEVIVGHKVAKQTGLSIGDTFLSAHGLVEADIEIHDQEFIVVGVLKPTQNVIDRLIVTNLESIWQVHDHEEAQDEHHEENHIRHDEEHDHEIHENEHETHEEADKNITSLLVSFRNPTGFLVLPRSINEATNMQAVLPKYELDKLYEYMGIGFKTITWIAYLILAISGLTIFISLYKMVKERAFDLALLRTYGATNFQLVQMIAYEGFAIIGVAFLLGFLLVKFALPLLFKLTDVDVGESVIKNLGLNDILQIEIVVFAIIAVSIVIAVYPILKMKISEILSNEK
ncbi:ABC transporter permease [Hyunsoonleella pacifica]|uniref:ABC transporter permease n=1 Tax=Hyunsoonleella pacifica TaxID=1080224 RepID=A0A4Q9FPI3_9FLAO|nr:ABC transporter permease [Hyunsoonleella pacifica]TBN16568.1 ABC transporter permease [Hyunsoonleella pacifica]GGD18352.1 permease [Hyunsoonleella pacifica]